MVCKKQEARRKTKMSKPHARLLLSLFSCVVYIAFCSSYLSYECRKYVNCVNTMRIHRLRNTCKRFEEKEEEKKNTDRNLFFFRICKRIRTTISFLFICLFLFHSLRAKWIAESNHRVFILYGKLSKRL